MHSNMLTRSLCFPCIHIDHVEQRTLQWAFAFDRPANVTTQNMDKRLKFVSEGLEDCNFLSPEIHEDFKNACKIKTRLGLGWLWYL